MKICGYFSGVITNSDYFFFFFFGGGGGSFLYILGLFKVNIQNWNIFFSRVISFFLGYD